MAYHPEAFEMFLSQEQVDVFRGERIPWLAEDTWRATGMDNTLFPKGEIPMYRLQESFSYRRTSQSFSGNSSVKPLLLFK